MEGEPSPTSLRSLSVVLLDSPFSSAAKGARQAQEETVLLLLGNKPTRTHNLGGNILPRPVCGSGIPTGRTGVEMGELSSRAASGSVS